MIHELATITVKVGAAELFEAAFAEAVPLFKRAKGCLSMRLERSLEEPLRYRIVIGWETMDDHVVGFRTSADHARWRELVGAYFDGPPEVDHVAVVAECF